MVSLHNSPYPKGGSSFNLGGYKIPEVTFFLGGGGHGDSKACPNGRTQVATRQSIVPLK